ncbi:coproporphyrinogen III oxidase [Ramicandelaber brevisporus]|nr:coproporphyrinogen III oxidase [Ramicandelaber brevisporus]
MLRRALSVYVHWPYCEQKCTYCAFNKYVDPNADVERMLRSLAADLAHSLRDYTRAWNGTTAVRSVFFGGGTPSLAPPELVSATLDTIRQHAQIETEMEVTLEANPRNVNADSLGRWIEAGVNRISLGIQSTNDSVLRKMGRDHTADMARTALELCRLQLPRHRVSVDVIYGRPGQTVAEWESELGEIAALNRGGHISAYQLTVERGTQLFRDVNKSAPAVAMPSEETMADFYHATNRVLRDNGFVNHYEVSNYGSSTEAECRHNTAYWRGGDYIGVGPGAHGVVTLPEGRKRVYRIASPAAWMAQCEQLDHGISKERDVPQDDTLRELIMLGLRTAKGIDKTTFAQFNEQEWRRFVDIERVKALADAGYVESDEAVSFIRPTEQGMAVADRLAVDAIV